MDQHFEAVNGRGSGPHDQYPSVLDQLGSRRRKFLKTDLTLNEEAIGMIARHSLGRRGLGVLAIFLMVGMVDGIVPLTMGAKNRKEDLEQV